MSQIRRRSYLVFPFLCILMSMGILSGVGGSGQMRIQTEQWQLFCLVSGKYCTWYCFCFSYANGNWRSGTCVSHWYGNLGISWNYSFFEQKE